MTNYIPQPITIRELPEYGLVLTQTGDQVEVNGAPRSVTTSADIRSLPGHYLRTALKSAMPRIESGEIAAIVHHEIDSKPAYLVITAAQWAVGAPERARYATWIAGRVASKAEREAKERAYDLVNNEGGEGFNPHRVGSAHTYGRGRG
jgi:hypothetical protein